MIHCKVVWKNQPGTILSCCVLGLIKITCKSSAENLKNFQKNIINDFIKDISAMDNNK